jgi:hypothetical protein
LNERAPAPANKRTYDVYLTAGAPRFYFVNDNHGVTLTDERIGWTFDGRADHAAFSDIVSIHLQTGGDWRNVIDQCTIELADETRLAITNGNASGRPDDTQTAIYRDFVRDLHRRLAARKDPSIRFTAGYTPGSYRVIVVCAILLGILCVMLPLILTLATGRMEMLGLLIAGGFLCWPLARMVLKNAPRAYTPQRIPDELLS